MTISPIASAYRFLVAVSVFSLALAAGCTSDVPADDDGDSAPECADNFQCQGNAAGPYCSAEPGTCGPPPLGAAIGWGDGSLESVSVAYVYAPEQALEATDIAFHPDRPNELWVLRRQYESSAPCNQGNATAAGCDALEGSVAVVTNPGTDQVAAQVYNDPNAWHFMRRPTAFAFGNNGTFANSAEARTGNYLDDQIDYIGPSLWSSNLDVFAIQPPGGNGSHLDMLHTSPFSMGIAHELDNAYWVFNGAAGSLDRYDFKGDHGPGNDDHSDGEVNRYVTGQLTRLPNVPSHMKLHKASGNLYVADSGAGRVVMLDIASGTVAAQAFTPNYDQLQQTAVMDGATLTEVVPAGTITAPSGLDIHEDVLYVTDNATGRIHAFSLAGEALRTLDTGLAPGALSPFVVGPDGKGYYADKSNGSVFRIDPM